MLSHSIALFLEGGDGCSVVGDAVAWLGVVHRFDYSEVVKVTIDSCFFNTGTEARRTISKDFLDVKDLTCWIG